MSGKEPAPFSTPDEDFAEGLYGDEDLDDAKFLAENLDIYPRLHPSETIHGASQREIFETFHFHPFILSGWMSAKLLPGYIGQLIAARTMFHNVDDERLMTGLRQSNRAMIVYMPHVMQARRGLRHDIAIQIGSILDSSSAAEALIDRLAPSLYILKVFRSSSTGVHIICTPGHGSL